MWVVCLRRSPCVFPCGFDASVLGSLCAVQHVIGGLVVLWLAAPCCSTWCWWVPCACVSFSTSASSSLILHVVRQVGGELAVLCCSTCHRWVLSASMSFDTLALGPPCPPLPCPQRLASFITLALIFGVGLVCVVTGFPAMVLDYLHQFGGSTMRGGDKGRSETTHEMGLPLSGSPLMISPLFPYSIQLPSTISIWPTSLWLGEGH